MVTLLIRYPVRDFDEYKVVFDRFRTVRERHGALSHRLYRAENDGEDVTVLVAFRSVDDVVGFLSDPERPGALQDAGIAVESQTMTLLRQVEAVEYGA